MEALKPFRAKIDELDEQILSLLGERYNVVRQVAAIKSEHGIASYLPDRVEEVKERCADIGEKHGLDRELVKTIYTLIIAKAVAMEDIKIKADQA